MSVCDNCRYDHLDGWADKSSRKNNWVIELLIVNNTTQFQHDLIDM